VIILFEIFWTKLTNENMIFYLLND